MTFKLYRQAIDKEGKPGLEFDFHYGQWDAWFSAARIVAVIAGSQGGKTSFGPWWLHREIELGGAGDYIAATATFDLFKLKMLPEIREVFEDVTGIGRYWSGSKVIEIANPETGKFMANRADDRMWARIILRSASSGSGLESSTGKAAWLDEAGMDEFPLTSFDGVERRLTLNQGRILITTTPYNLGWLKQQIIDKNGQGGIEVFNFPSIANPAFPKAEFDRLQEKLPTWKFNMFHRGLLSRPPGMIYSDFIDAYKGEATKEAPLGGHKVHPFEIDPDWPRYVGVDPGANNTAKVWVAHDPVNDVYYLYRESLDGGKTSSQHAKETKELAEKNKERVIMHFVGQKSEKEIRWSWAAAGVRNVSEPPEHEVETGIDKVIELLKTFRLYIFDTCTGVLDEIGRYSRKLDEMGNVLDEIKDKATFHHLDAVRYDVLGCTAYKNKKWEARIA
jgi:hypothetical protein